MKKYYLPVAVVAIIAILVASSFAMGAAPTSSSTPNADPGVESEEISITARDVRVSWNCRGPGSVAVYQITFVGSGYLYVYCADYNPSVWPDYWRKTITQVGANAAQSAVSYPSLTYNTPATRYCVSGQTIKVLVSWDRGRGAGSWAATCYIRFYFTGTYMYVTALQPVYW